MKPKLNKLGGLKMDGKFLGKIAKAEFGTYSDRPFLMGLQIEFRFDGGGVSDGGRHLVNISDSCKWDNEEEKNNAFQKVLKDTANVLKEAKVNHVSQLVGKPIEIVIENQQYESFRILTEVL